MCHPPVNIGRNIHHSGWIKEVIIVILNANVLMVGRASSPLRPGHLAKNAPG